VALAPLDVLYDEAPGDELPLPPTLARLYGPLRLPSRTGRPLVLGNFVSTLDGVVALNAPGTTGGGEISGFNKHDRVVMGLLRAVVGAVVVGAGTLRADAGGIWTAEDIYPSLASAYDALRAARGLSSPPLNVFVTASGLIDPNLRVFQAGEVPALIVTSAEGGRRLVQGSLPPTVAVVAVEHEGPVTARFVLDAIARIQPCDVVLCEGGPHLMGDFVAERLLDELFLTLAPQVAGRDDVVPRPGFVAGLSFAPTDPRWATLASVRRAQSHLLLRYSFQAQGGTGD
jgi:riboflavin biosynthesis pyrimidine reductase